MKTDHQAARDDMQTLPLEFKRPYSFSSMQTLRALTRMNRLARLALAWFALTLAVAGLSPIVDHLIDDQIHIFTLSPLIRQRYDMCSQKIDTYGN